jgi:hypothetical protein
MRRSDEQIAKAARGLLAAIAPEPGCEHRLDNDLYCTRCGIRADLACKRELGLC